MGPGGSGATRTWPHPMTDDRSPAPGPVAPALSVVLCTFNRSHLLSGALSALVDQGIDTPPYEVIVVDNNSTDCTRSLIGTFAGTGLVRYEHEPVQGLSAARNRGIRMSRAPLIAFTDDDVRVDPSWVRTIVLTFARCPDVDLAGGRVEPEWEAPPPRWLARAGLAPLALVDYGDAPFRIDRTRPVCLVGANLCIRREAIEAVGLFSTEVQRVKDSVGSTEDQELEARLLAAGRTALYEPGMRVRAVVPHARLSKQYHRAWHTGHGRFYALMRDPLFEGSTGRRLFGIPAHVYRKAAREAVAWARSLILLNISSAFRHELRLRFLMAFARQRLFGRA